MGEDPEKIFTLGAPGLDHIYLTPLPDRKDLQKELGIDLTKGVAVITYHPVTLEFSTAGQHMSNLLAAIRDRINVGVHLCQCRYGRAGHKQNDRRVCEE